MSAAAIPEVVSTFKKGVDAAHEALDLYQDVIKTIIPWDTFDDTIKQLEANKNQYSNKAAVIVGSVKTALLDSKDTYVSASLEVYRWCKSSSNLLKTYLKLFADIKETNVAEAQKTLMLAVLEKGEKTMTQAMERLEKSKSSFNKASGDLTALKTVLDNDFSAGSAYYDSSIAKIRTEAYAGAAAGAVFGPIGLAVAYAIAAGVVEGELIPNMKKAFKETQQKFDELNATVDKSLTAIGEARKEITTKIKSINTIRGKIEETEDLVDTWALIPTIMFVDLKKSTTDLIDLCNAYVKAEDDKV